MVRNARSDNGTGSTQANSTQSSAIAAANPLWCNSRRAVISVGVET
jgi:hypothetical protein